MSSGSNYELWRAYPVANDTTPVHIEEELTPVPTFIDDSYEYFSLGIGDCRDSDEIYIGYSTSGLLCSNQCLGREFYWSNWNVD
jgi:hypothetical protein